MYRPIQTCSQQRTHCQTKQTTYHTGHNLHLLITKMCTITTTNYKCGCFTTKLQQCEKVLGTLYACAKPDEVQVQLPDNCAEHAGKDIPKS
jgi:hypothetical protein